MTAITDHPIPMQLTSTSVGAAAKKYAVPPKLNSDASGDSTVSISSVCNIDASAECMIVEGYICGNKSRILIDSGAKMSHISSAFVNKHQLRTVTSEVPTVLVMADGHKQVIDHVVPNAELQLHDNMENIDMLVMDMTHYDAILGMNWHYAHDPVTYDYGTVAYTHHGNTHVLKRDDNAYQSIKSKYFVSAVALSRMIRPRRIRAAGGVEGDHPSIQLYAM